MAQSGYTPIQLYRTTTLSAAPTSGNLAAGELAININDADMALYAKNNTGNVTRLINNPASLKYPTADGSAGQAVKTDGSGNLSIGTLGVPGGGTGLTTATAYGLLAAGTTSTGNFQQVSGTGSSGQILTSNGAGALPSWQNNTGITTGKSIAMAMIFGF